MEKVDSGKTLVGCQLARLLRWLPGLAGANLFFSLHGYPLARSSGDLFLFLFAAIFI